MAVLSATERANLHARFMRDSDFPDNNEKQDIRDAVDDGDVWMNSNFGQFTAALPVAFRSASNADQRRKLFNDLALARKEAGV